MSGIPKGRRIPGSQPTYRETRTPIRCRVCLRNMGYISGFEGRVFMLCQTCEEVIRLRKKAGL